MPPRMFVLPPFEIRVKTDWDERTHMCVILYCAAVRFTSTIISNMKVGQADRWTVVLISELEVNEVQRSENVSLKITCTICT